MDAKAGIKNLLLLFVLVSIGYALGKEVTLRSVQGKAGEQPGPAASGQAADGAIVYYLHQTIRCVTCNTIEKAALEVVKQDFAADFQAGRLRWQMANMEEEEALAKRYDVASSTVVVVRIRGGKEAGFQRLDDTWTLTDQPEKLREYIRKAVAAALSSEAKP